MLDFLKCLISVTTKPRGPLTLSYILRAADLPFLLEFLVSYDTNMFLVTSIKDVEKISHFFSRFALGHLLGSLDPAVQPLFL